MPVGATSLSLLKTLFSSVSYPVIIGMAFVIYFVGNDLGLSPILAAYVALIAGAASIMLHERILPYRRAWTPGSRDVSNDAAYMLLVQAVLPYLLSISLVVWGSAILASHGLKETHLWPHQWPVVVQVCLMLLCADFARYWMHRAFHKFEWLWQFHAVHHSPHKLYWLNVGRFHPIEKSIQFCVDALPFALLGVSQDVLAAYLIFYGINGFFQHSNCLIRLGPLNFVVSGPELHRWHHSVLPAESDNNFGNNLIIWDLLFGSRFLPAGRDVGELGLLNRTYPTGLVKQLSTPFSRGLDKL